MRLIELGVENLKQPSTFGKKFLKPNNMKHLYTLFAVLLTLNLSAQTNYKQADALVKDLARFWSDPSNLEQLNSGRSGFVVTHKLDSLVTRNDDFFRIAKTEMEYNSLGHTTKMYQYGVDSVTQVFRLEGTTTFEYETPGYPSRILVDGLNTETGQFESQLEMELFYDGSNRLDSAVISLEDPLFGGGFGPFIAIKQVYNGDLIEQTRQWLFVALLGGWLQASVTDFQYDASDRLTDQLTSSIDFGTGEIIPSDRVTYTYNVEGLKESETQWGWADPVWEPIQRTNYEYHANETIFNETLQVYNATTAQWENSYWTKYPVENATEEYPSSSYSWDAVAGEWVVVDSIINLLNPALTWGQIAVPSQIAVLSLLGGELTNDVFGDPEGSSIDETRYFVTGLTPNLSYESSDFYYYSLLEGSKVNTVLPENISVSPNPANDQFTIAFDQQAKEKYTIVNITGVTIAKGDLQRGKNFIQTSGWAPGVYYITMQLEDGTVYVQKQSVQQ